MEFCPKCGGLIIDKKKNSQCMKCGYTIKGIIKIKSSEKIEKKPEVGIIKDKDVDIFPVTNAECRKCRNKEAYFWTTQTRAGDEAETRFFKCTKCKYSWREYR